MLSFGLSQINLTHGLTLDQWKAIEISLQSAKDPAAWIAEAISQHEGIAEKALEAGFYKLAALLGCKNPVQQARALILSSQRSSAEVLMQSLSNGPEKIFCEILFERTQGQSLKVYDLYKDQVESLFQSFSTEMQADVRMQWALVLYNLEKWDDVIRLYKTTFELAEKSKLSAVKAVVAFNMATVYENLNQKIESKTWLWIAQKELESYCLDHLSDSIELYEIQCALKELNDEVVIEKSQKYLKKDNLGVMQRIRSLHALAESQSEHGEILDAEMILSLSRKIILQNQYEQYADAQEILELNLASVVHRPSRFQNRKNLAKYSVQQQHKAAQARWAMKMNDQSRVLRLAADLKKEDPQNEAFDDLFVLLTNRLEQPGKRARTLENQILKSWLSKQWKALEYIKTFLEIEKSNSPWKKCLYKLTEGLIAFIQYDTVSSRSSWIEVVEISKNHGLERLESLSSLLLKTLHSEQISMAYDLQPEELAFYESLISKLSTNPIAVSRNEQGKVMLGFEKTDLVFDEDKNEVLWQDQVISLQNQPILQRLLKALFANPQGISKEKLIEAVWGLDYHPLHHDPMIYSAMGRLRDLIPVEMNEGSYRLPGSLKWTYLSQNKMKSFKLSERQKQLMEIVEKMQSLSRREVVEALGISERTALRELTHLVRMGLLEQNGSGRGVHYTKLGQGA